MPISSQALISQPQRTGLAGLDRLAKRTRQKEELAEAVSPAIEL